MSAHTKSISGSYVITHVTFLTRLSLAGATLAEVSPDVVCRALITAACFVAVNIIRPQQRIHFQQI